MPLDYEALSAYRIPQTEMALTKRDTMLYALGVGLGSDPTDERQLRFVYEKNLLTVPTMATLIAAPHAWIRKANVGSSGKSVHAGISFRLHRPIPVEGSFRSENTVDEVVDKGEGKAALVTTRRRVFSQQDDALIFEILSTSMQRGDGGFGGPSTSSAPVHEVPGSPPDMVVDMPTLPQQGLIYRLSGDYNPLHADPEHARSNGFPRPILHGLSTYGIAGHALLSALCDYEPARLVAMSARFSKPVYPGDTLQIQIWQRGDTAHFRCLVPARDNEVVLDFGHAELA